MSLFRPSKGLFLIGRLWYPLALTWLMMSVEGPFLVAVMSRLPQPTENLAAFSVAFAVALLVESPIMMLLSAGAALGSTRLQYERLFRFASLMNIPLSGLLFFLGIPAIFDQLSQSLWQLPSDVSHIVQVSLWLLVPWPAAIGYRRLWQGILIRRGRSRLITAGTGIRLGGMAATALGLKFFSDWPGAWVGAAALSIGVLSEMIAVRFWASKELATLPCTSQTEVLSFAQLWAFYAPLLITSVIHVALNPLLTFLMARGREAVTSLAVFPAVTGTVFLYSCLGVAYQEVVIVLMGSRVRRLLWVFALGIAALGFVGLGLTAWPAFSDWWLEALYGLPEPLLSLAQKGLWLSLATPPLVTMLAYYKGIFIYARLTRLNLMAAIIEVTAVIGLTAGLLFGLQVQALEGAIIGLVGSRGMTLLWAALMRKRANISA